MKTVGVPVTHGQQRATAFINARRIETVEPLNEQCSEIHFYSGHRLHVELNAVDVSLLIDGGASK